MDTQHLLERIEDLQHTINSNSNLHDDIKAVQHKLKRFKTALNVAEGKRKPKSLCDINYHINEYERQFTGIEELRF